MRSKLILNPVSGTDTGPDYLPAINSRLREQFGALDIVLTTGEGDATAAAASAARDGYDIVFAGGGDGTLNEVLNGIASVDGALGRTTLGVIPLGTGNDFSQALGFPADVDEAVEVLCRAHTGQVDVGVLNGHYFVNVSAGGFIAEVSDAVNPRLKTVAGKLAYLIGGAVALLNFEPVHARVSTGDGRSFDLDLQAFAVCNAPLIGGGRPIAPLARPDDGELDVCLFQAMPVTDFVALLARVPSTEHIDDPRVRYFRASSVDIAFDRRIKVNVDGQVLEADTCHYTLLPAAARILVP